MPFITIKEIISRLPEGSSIDPNEIYEKVNAFLNRNDKDKKYIINVQPGDPDTLEMASIVINILSNKYDIDVKSQVSLVIANPMANPETAIVDSSTYKENGVEWCSITSGMDSVPTPAGELILKILKKNDLVSEDYETKTQTINWPKDLDGFLQKNASEEYKELLKIMGPACKFIINAGPGAIGAQVCLCSDLSQEGRKLDFMESILHGLGDKNTQVMPIIEYLAAKSLGAKSSKEPAGWQEYLHEKNVATKTLKLKTEEVEQFERAFIYTMLERENVNRVIAREFDRAWGVTTYQGGLYADPVDWGIHLGLNTRMLRGIQNTQVKLQQLTSEEKAEINNLSPEERQQFMINKSMSLLDQNSQVAPRDLYRPNDLEQFVTKLDGAFIFDGAPSTYCKLIYRNDPKAFQNVLADTVSLEMSKTDNDSENLFKANYNDAGDPTATHIKQAANLATQVVTTGQVKPIKAIGYGAFNAEMERDFNSAVNAKSNFLLSLRQSYNKEKGDMVPAFCLSLPILYNAIATDVKNAKDYASLMEGVAVSTREKASWPSSTIGNNPHLKNTHVVDIKNKDTSNATRTKSYISPENKPISWFGVKLATSSWQDVPGNALKHLATLVGRLKQEKQTQQNASKDPDGNIGLKAVKGFKKNNL